MTGGIVRVAALGVELGVEYSGGPSPAAKGRHTLASFPSPVPHGPHERNRDGMGDESPDDLHGSGENNRRHSEEDVAMPNDPIILAGGPVALLAPEVSSGRESLPADRCLQIHRL